MSFLRQFLFLVVVAGCLLLHVAAQQPQQVCMDNPYFAAFCPRYLSRCRLPAWLNYLRQYCARSCGFCPEPSTTTPSTTATFQRPASWSQWSQYGECSVTCGRGRRESTRTCIGETATNRCIGQATRYIDCSQRACPVWSAWAPFGSCSAPCDGGLQEERRNCDNGPGCEGESSRRILPCNTQPCSGPPAAWTVWTGCSATCGIGYQTRSQLCGSGCNNFEHRQCNTNNQCQCSGCNCADNPLYLSFCTITVANAKETWCPFYPNLCPKTCGRCPCGNCVRVYASWSDYGQCSRRCGGGDQYRYRNCNNINGCSGPYFQERDCATTRCSGVVTCPLPQTNNALMYSPQKTSYNSGESVTYTCVTGTISGQDTSTCSSAGAWSLATLPTCSRNCPDPPSPAYLTITSSGGPYNPTDTVTYACAGGNLVGSATISCRADGTWSGGAPACTCSTPPTSSALTYSPQRTSYRPRDTITYRCVRGNIVGSGTNECTEDGTWSNTRPTCDINCPDPPSQPHLTITTSGGPYNPTDSVTYACAGGSVVGSATITCGADGTWSGGAPTCRCSNPPSPSYLSITTSGSPYNPGATATYSCSDGSIVGSATITCRADGTWSDDAPTCNCPDPPSPSHLTITASGGPYDEGDTVSYACADGNLVGSDEITCLADGTWGGDPPTCTCSTPPTSSSLTYSQQRTSYRPRDTITYGCVRGNVVGSSTNECMENGTWSNPRPTCDINCPDPPSPTYLTITSSGGPYNPTDTVTYACAGGNLVGSATITCRADGTWSGGAPTCRCPNPPSPSYLTTTSSGGPYNAGNTVSYACAGGSVVGSNTITCREDGTWSGDAPTCGCSDPPSPSYLTVTPSGGPYNSTDTVTYACAGGSVVGSATITCQADGTWSGSAPTCRCSDPPSPSHLTSTASGGPYNPTVAVAYACAGGNVVGSATIRCRADGTWSGGAPTCTCSTPPTSDNVSYQPVQTTYNPSASITYSCTSGTLSGGVNNNVCSANGQWSNSAPTCQSNEVTWTEWSRWTSCPVSCGRGDETRTRTCRNGDTCPGKSMESRTCTVAQVCPCVCASTSTCSDRFEEFCRDHVPLSDCGNLPWYRDNCAKKCRFCSDCNPCGTWGAWRIQTECSVACGSGESTRTRVCPSGFTCNGKTTDTVPCNLRPCGPHWLAWGPWSPCTKDCNTGMHTRVRVCSVPTGNACGDPSGKTESGSCNIQSCEETWFPWGNWQTCTKTCGPGVQRIVRRCRGSSCVGQLSTTRGCNLKDCQSTTSWSVCSRSCGKGTRTRMRCSTPSSCTLVYDDCNDRSCVEQNCDFPLRKRYKTRSHECCDGLGLTQNSCGVSIRKGRIINGRDAEIDQWPWMVYIRVGGNLCGGTLLTSRIVLTAAHCLEGSTASTFRILLGALRSTDRSSLVQVKKVKKLFSHPRYNFPANDIAIIEMSEPADLSTKSVRTICLPRGETTPNDVACIAAGWGLTRPRNDPSSALADKLQEVDLRTLPFGVCGSGYANENSVNSAMNENTMICAGAVLGGVDTCNGDSGGPLMCQRCANCAWMVAGVTSFGDTNCGVARKPGVYTRVSAYTDFINDVQRQVIQGLTPEEQRKEEQQIATGSFASCT